MADGMSCWDWTEREDVIAHVLYGNEYFVRSWCTIIDAQITADPSQDAHEGSCLLWLALRPRLSPSRIAVCRIRRWHPLRWGYRVIYEDMGIPELNCPRRLLAATTGSGPFSQRWRRAAVKAQARGEGRADASPLLQLPTIEEWKQCVRRQKKRRKEMGVLHRAVRAGDVKRVRRLLEAGTDANTLWDYRTPLDLAVETGSLRITRLLLQHGADVNASRGGACIASLLHLARRKGRHDIVKLLRAHGMQCE